MRTQTGYLEAKIGCPLGALVIAIAIRTIPVVEILAAWKRRRPHADASSDLHVLQRFLRSRLSQIRDERRAEKYTN